MSAKAAESKQLGNIMIPLCILSALSTTLDIIKIDLAVAQHKTKILQKQIELLANAIIIVVATAIAIISGRMTVWGYVLLAATMLVAIVNVGIVIVAVNAARRKKL